MRVERQRWKAEMAGEMAMGRAVCREEKKFSGGRRRLGVKEIGLGFLFPFFVCQNCPFLKFSIAWYL